jgi:hypothetical protein
MSKITIPKFLQIMHHQSTFLVSALFQQPEVDFGYTTVTAPSAKSRPFNFMLNERKCKPGKYYLQNKFGLSITFAYHLVVYGIKHSI